VIWLILYDADKDLELIIVNCDCGCDEAIHIKKYVYDDIQPDYYISICGGKFYLEQTGIFKRLWRRIKNSWKALIGKDYVLCEINIKPENIDELIEKLKEIRK